MNEDEFIEEIVQLAEQAREQNENNIAIVLFALCGAVKAGEGQLLATHMQSFIKETLKPNIERRIATKFSDN